MTNHWIDLKNTDCALIIGSNAAENHPMSFKWLNQARSIRGAKVIHVDPRYTRTSAQSDYYAKLRPGTDIAFIGGLINYAISNNLVDMEYVRTFTNASFLVDEKFGFQDGLFSGYDPLTRSYDQATWSFQRDANGVILKDSTLQHQRTVWQLLVQHYQRYTVETVSKVTGMSLEEFNTVATVFCSTFAKDKAGTIMYAMGTTQHTVGSQNVRSYAILQFLLGNMGKCGGGINALRGESNVQGSTDVGLLFNALPGYLNCPTNSESHKTLESYNKTETPLTGYWSNKPKFFNSLLKAWYGPNATATNEFCYHNLPKRQVNKNYSYINLFEEMYEGNIKGLFCFGMNPLVSGPNFNKAGEALKKLDWLVAVDLWETETAAFWKTPGFNSSSINTEVFLLPAASAVEKEGSITNSGRMMQYRWKAIEPTGQAKSDLEILHTLMLKIKGLYSGSSLEKDKPIQELFWPYGTSNYPNLDQVQREINGYRTSDNSQLDSFGQLSADGSTAAGLWIYCGYYTSQGNKSKNRNSFDDSGIGNFSGWGYTWPLNRRILYNRASADLSGNPWDTSRALVWWDGSKWTGKDVPDFNPTLKPDAPGGSNPFIMLPDGVGSIFGKLNEGPFPEHYEPFETPSTNLLSGVQLNPVVKVLSTPMNAKGTTANYPIIASTYRVSEHWQTGTMTRNLPWLAELMPEMFVELSESLASAKGITNGESVIIASARGEIRAKALITKRVKPLDINGKKVEQIGLPWHWGHQGVTTGESANKLTPNVGDGNTMIPEYKAFLVDVRKVG